MKTLYKRTKKGQVQTWRIEVADDKFRTHEGIDKITSSEWTVCQSSNVGKSNEKSAQEQAEFEAQAKYQKKLDQGYVEDIKDIDNQHHFEPQLAHKWKDYKDKVKFPVFCQRKLDGIRCIATKNGLFTRNGKLIVSIPHVNKSIEYLFEKYPDLVLDGEIFNEKLKDNFNKIASIVKKVKNTEESLLESEKYAQYHIYDCCFRNQEFITMEFSSRYDFLINHIEENKYIILVKTYFVQTQNELNKYYEQFLEERYEGLIVRLDAFYENKRSKNLLKMKPFETDEFEIIDIIEGEGNKTRMVGALVCRTKDGKIFNSNLKGGFEISKQIWINKNNYIGKTATIRYQNLTPDNIPRFPYCIAIDRESYE